VKLAEERQMKSRSKLRRSEISFTTGFSPVERKQEKSRATHGMVRAIDFHGAQQVEFISVDRQLYEFRMLILDF
jgi:hypothetical protein